MYRDDAQRPAPRKPLVAPQCSTPYSQTRVQCPSTAPACPTPCQIPSPSAGCVKHPDAPVSMSVRISSKSLGRCATHFGREKPGGWTHGGAGQLPEKWGEWSFVTLEMGVVVRVFCSWRGWGQGCFLRKQCCQAQTPDRQKRASPPVTANCGAGRNHKLSGGR